MNNVKQHTSTPVTGGIILTLPGTHVACLEIKVPRKTHSFLKPLGNL